MKKVNKVQLFNLIVMHQIFTMEPFLTKCFFIKCLMPMINVLTECLQLNVQYQ